MAKIKIDLRKSLRAIAQGIQALNADRLLSGQGVNGQTLAPRREENTPAASGKRIRHLGVRVSLSQLASKVGVKTGALLRDLTRAGNVRLGRVGFKIVPSADVLRRMFALSAGSKHQVARPFSGVSEASLRDARDQIARDGREQIVKQMNAGLRDARR